MIKRKKVKMRNEYLTYPKLLYYMRKQTVSKAEFASYGENSAQHIIINIPKDLQKSTLMVYIHGGGWRNGSPKEFSAIGEFLARQGFVAAMLGYRKAPKYKYPCQIEDICLALKKTIDIMEIKEIKYDGIVVIGSSAGGHLGALLCLDKELHRKYNLQTDSFQGLCSLSGILSFDECLPNGSFNHLLKGLLKSSSDYNLANPINHIIGDEKFCLLCLHGKEDPLVFAESAQAFFGKFETEHKLSKQFELMKNKYHSDVSVGLFYYDNDEKDIFNAWLNYFD